MAELVGLAASIIQIAGAGVKLSTTLYNFVGSATRADQEITDIAGDVEITANALDSVGKVFEDEDAPSVVSKKAIEHANSLIKRCEAVFGEIYEVINKRRILSRDGKKSLSALGKLAWPMKEQKIELLRRRLESLKNSLILLFHVLQLANGQARGKLEKKELEREREKIRELHQRQQDSIRNLEALEAKFRKATIDDDETLSGSTTVSRTTTFNLMAIPSLLIDKIEKKPDSQLRTKSVMDTSPLTDDSEMSDSEGTATDEEAEHLTLDELSQCAKHVQKLLKRISTLQETFETSKAARRLPKTRVHKLYRRFCQKFESQVTPRASATIQDSLLPLPAFVPPSHLEAQQEPTYEALSRDLSVPDALKKEHKPHLSLSALPPPREYHPHPRPKTPSMVQSHSQDKISGPSTKPMPVGSQSSSGGNSPTPRTPESGSVLSASNGKPPKTAVEIPSALNRVQDIDFLTLRHQSMPNHRDNKLDMLEVEAYQRSMRGSDDPITNKIHMAAKRGLRVVPNSLEFKSKSTRTKYEEGGDKASRVSVSNRTNITNGGNGGEVRLRVDASAPLNLQFNGDMEDHTLQVNPPEDAMTEIGMGSQKVPREKSSRPLNERPDREYHRGGTRRVLRRRRELSYYEAEPEYQNVAPKPLTPSDDSVRHIPRRSSISPLSRKPRQRRQITETEDCTDPNCTKCIISRGNNMRYNNTGRNAQSSSVVNRSSRENGSQRGPRPLSYHMTSSNNNLSRPPLSLSHVPPLSHGPPLSYGPPLVTQGESYNRMPSARYAPPSQSVRHARLAPSESSESEYSTEDEVEDRYSRSSRALMPPPPVTKTPAQRRPSLRHAATTQVYNVDRMSQSQTFTERSLVTPQIMERRSEGEAQRAQLKASLKSDEKAVRRRQVAAGVSGTEPAMSLPSTSPVMRQAQTAQQVAASRASGSDFRTGASAEQSAQFPAENLKQTNLLDYQSSSLVMWSGSKDRKQMDDLPSNADQKPWSPNATAGMHHASSSREAQHSQPSSERGSRERDGEVEPMDIGPPVASMTSKEMSVEEIVVDDDDDEKDSLYKEMMEELAGNDSSEESVEESEVTPSLSKSLDMVNMQEDPKLSPAMPPVYEKPLFINPKQFDRILKRRLTRQRIEQNDIANDPKKDTTEADTHNNTDPDNVGATATEPSHESAAPSESAISYSEQKYVNNISPNQSISPPNAVTHHHIDLTAQLSKSSTPYQPPISEGAVLDSSSRDFAASPGSPCRKRARDETTEQSSSAENNLLATSILKSESEIAAATERKAEIAIKRAKLRDLKEYREKRMEAFPLAEEERRSETYIDGVYSSRRSCTGSQALSPMTDWDSVKIHPTDDWRVVESKRAKRNDMIRQRRELRKVEKETMKATPIAKVSSLVDNLLDLSTAASGPYGTGPSSSQEIEQHYPNEERQSLTDTDAFTEVGRHVAPIQNKPEIPSLAQESYVPSSVTAAQTQSTRPTAPPSQPPLQSPIPVPWNLQRITLLDPHRFAETPKIAGPPRTSNPDVCFHREIDGEETLEFDEKYAMDEYGNFILDDAGHRVPYHSLRQQDRRRKLEQLAHTRLGIPVTEHAKREPPERDDSRDPRTERVGTGAPTMASSMSRPALLQHAKAQSAFEPARNAHVIVGNLNSRRRQSYQSYVKHYEAEERSQRLANQNSRTYAKEPDQDSRMYEQNLAVEPSARRWRTDFDARHSKVYANSGADIGETRQLEAADRRAQEESKQIRFELARGEERAQKWSGARVAMRDSRGAEDREEARRQKLKESIGKKKQFKSAEVNPTRVQRLPTRDPTSKRYLSRRSSLTHAQAQERDLLLAETEAQMVREREATEQREREERVELLGYQQQTYGYYDSSGASQGTQAIGRTGSLRRTKSPALSQVGVSETHSDAEWDYIDSSPRVSQANVTAKHTDTRDFSNEGEDTSASGSRASGDVASEWRSDHSDHSDILDIERRFPPPAPDPPPFKRISSAPTPTIRPWSKVSNINQREASALEVWDGPESQYEDGDGDTIMDDKENKEQKTRGITSFLSTYNVDAESDDTLTRPRWTIKQPHSGHFRLNYDTVMTEGRGVEKDIVDLLLEEWTVVPVH